MPPPPQPQHRHSDLLPLQSYHQGRQCGMPLDVRYRCVYCVYGLCLPALSQCLRVFTNFCASLRNKNTRNVICDDKKASAAAGKTSPGLIHVTKSQGRYLELKKGACSSRKDLTKANTCRKQIRTQILLKKSACGSREDFTKLVIWYKISGTSFLRKKQRLRQPGRPYQA